ncbi:Uncharacterized protein SCF082_LOCUS23950, partial [Durusdinium trenchii]
MNAELRRKYEAFCIERAAGKEPTRGRRPLTACGRRRGEKAKQERQAAEAHASVARLPKATRDQDAKLYGGKTAGQANLPLDTPGPGAYMPQEKPTSTGITIAASGRRQTCQGSSGPGPGRYDVERADGVVRDRAVAGVLGKSRREQDDKCYGGRDELSRFPLDRCNPGFKYSSVKSSLSKRAHTIGVRLEASTSLNVVKSDEGDLEVATIPDLSGVQDLVEDFATRRARQNPYDWLDLDRKVKAKERLRHARRMAEPHSLGRSLEPAPQLCSFARESHKAGAGRSSTTLPRSDIPTADLRDNDDLALSPSFFAQLDPGNEPSAPAAAEARGAKVEQMGDVAVRDAMSENAVEPTPGDGGGRPQVAMHANSPWSDDDEDDDEEDDVLQQRSQQPAAQSLDEPSFKLLQQANKDALLENRMDQVRRKCEETVGRFSVDVQNLSIELAKTKNDLVREQEARANLEQVRVQHEKDIGGLTRELRSMTVEIRDAAMREKTMEERQGVLRGVLAELGVASLGEIRKLVRTQRQSIHQLEASLRGQQQQLEWSLQAQKHLQEQCKVLERDAALARKARWEADSQRIRAEEDREQEQHDLRKSKLLNVQLKAQVSHLTEKLRAASTHVDILGRAAIDLVSSPRAPPLGVLRSRSPRAQASSPTALNP